MAQTYGVDGARGAPANAEVSRWAVGWTAFAGVLLIVQGCWWGMAGLIALVNDEFYVVTQDYVFQFDTTTWGWIHLALAALLFAAGIGLFGGYTWARVVGVIVASVAMLVAFAWLPWYPLWAVLCIAVSISVLWALTTHGRDITTI